MSDLLSPIRADGHQPQGTDPSEARDALKAAIWSALQPFAYELERSGSVTFMGLRNAVADAVRPFASAELDRLKRENALLRQRIAQQSAFNPRWKGGNA